MKTIDQIRRERLEQLISGFSSVRLFAEKIEKSPAQVSQWKNASIDSKTKRPRGIADSTAREIEYKLGKPSGWMDVLDQNELASNPDRPLFEQDDNGIYLPLLNIRASMGNGADFKNDDLVIDVLRVTKSWVDKTLRNITAIENLSFIHAIGDSMHPTFNDGDILLVDSGTQNVTSDNIYVLEAHDRLFIKRVRRRLDGDFEISSDNPAVKTVDVLSGNAEVVIKGRVVWVWNGKRV